MSDFVRSVDLFISRSLSPEARSAALAAFAREDVARLQREGRASTNYRVFVDERPDAAPETVRPEGRIRYEFNGAAEAVAFALSYLVARSPRKSGDYKKSWFVLVDGAQWTGPLSDLPVGESIAVVNTQPYHRKIDTGAQGIGVAGRLTQSRNGGRSRKRGHHVSSIESCRQELLRRFPGIIAQRVFLELPNGPAPAPYVLKGGLVRRDRRLLPRQKAPKGLLLGNVFSRAGEVMTYPALIIEWKGSQ